MRSSSITPESLKLSAPANKARNRLRTTALMPPRISFVTEVRKTPTVSHASSSLKKLPNSNHDT